MDDLRPHLLIPETEVDYIEPPPPRGSKKEDVDHFEHGTKLSTGLQEITNAYTRVQGAGSLHDEDIRVFEVLEVVFTRKLWYNKGNKTGKRNVAWSLERYIRVICQTVSGQL